MFERLNSHQESRFKDEKKSGIFSSGLGITIGKQQQSTDRKGNSTTAAASTVGSTQGEVIIRAGRSYSQTGSDVLAPQGDIAIEAQRIEVLQARETSREQTESKSRQSGLTIALSNPVVDAIRTADQMKSAASKTSDPRMQALALASTALSAKNALDAVQANPGEAGAIKLSISIGSSGSQSNSTQSSHRGAGSSLAAAGNVSMVASGAGQDSKLTIQGSNVKAGNNIQLSADDKIDLLAGKNTSEQHSTNKSSGASIGASFGTDGVLLTTSASRARGKAEGHDVTWSATHVDAGNRLGIRSGADTSLQGALASGKQVIADVGGHLKIQSLQDTSQFASRQQSAGASLSAGVGKVGGSLNIGTSKAEGDFASVTEPSAIKAGDGGFQIDVKGNTDLVGAAISSTQRAAQEARNSLNTATLTHSDIQNRERHDASGLSIGLASSGNGSSSAGMGSDTGRQSSTTPSAISQATVTITDNAKQQELTGKTAAETVATLNRDASTDKDTSAALSRARDGNQLMADVQAQSQITAAFGANAAKQVGHYAGNKARELRRQGNDAEARKWDEGGEYRVMLHTAAGALGGGLQGAAGAAASATAMAEIGKAIDDMDMPAPVRQVLDAVAAAAIGTAAAGGAGAAAAFNTDLNNRQLHPTEIQWIQSNAKRYARRQGITPEEAEQRLSEQAFRQLQFGAEGDAAAWDAQASTFLRQAANQLLPGDPNVPGQNVGHMFHATPDQRANASMYLASTVAYADFYKRNGLQQPTLEQLTQAAQRNAQIRANLGTATKAALGVSAAVALAGLSPVLLQWALINPIAATQAGIITAETAAGIVSGAVTPNGLLQQVSNPQAARVVYNRLAAAATKNIASREVVLGRYHVGSVDSYEQIARARGATYYEVAGWNAIKKELGSDEKMWEINKAFLDKAIADGKSFVFTSDPIKILNDAPGSSSAKEVKYLQEFFEFRRKGDLWHGIKK